MKPSGHGSILRRAAGSSAWLATALVFAFGCDVVVTSTPPPKKPRPTTQKRVAPRPATVCPAAQCVAMGHQAIRSRDYQKAGRFFTEACNKNIVEGCVKVADMYRQGTGTARNPKTAAMFYERACNGGHAEACTTAGIMCERGDMAVRDETRSHRLYQRGCKEGAVMSCFNAGLQASRGSGCTRDEARAVDLFASSCELDSATGCMNGAILLYRERGRQDKNARAAQMFGRACELGSADGCLKLGLATLRGEGVTQSRDGANAQFKRACDGGESDGCHAVETLKKVRASSDGRDAVIPLTSSVPTITMKELTVKELSCRLPSQGPWALAEVTENLARQKKAIDKCVPDGKAVEVSMTLGRKKSSKIEVDGDNKRTTKCLKRALRRVKSKLPGTCSGILLVGDYSAAHKAYVARDNPHRRSAATTGTR